METVVEPVGVAVPLYGPTTVTKRAGRPTTTVPGAVPAGAIVVIVVEAALAAVRKRVEVT